MDKQTVRPKAGYRAFYVQIPEDVALRVDAVASRGFRKGAITAEALSDWLDRYESVARLTDLAKTS